MWVFPSQDGRILHMICIWNDPQTVDAVLSLVTKHLNVVSCFMMCAVGLGICVWTVQARGFNCSLPLKLIQNHLDPLSAGTAGDLSLSAPVWLSVSLTHSPLLCQVYLSFQLPWTILLLCHSVARVMCMWVWGCCRGICYLKGTSRFNITLTSMHACWAST